MRSRHHPEGGAGKDWRSIPIFEVLKDFCKVRELSRTKCSGRHSKFRGRKIKHDETERNYATAGPSAF